MGKTTGNNSGQGAAPVGVANVVPLRGQPQRAEPPPGWVVDSPYGHLRCDATPAGRLVRLADVVLWLMGSPKELPRKAAIEAVCSALTPELYGHLYMVRKADYAQPVGGDWMWGYQTDAQYRAGVEKQAQDHRQKQFENDQRSAWQGGFGTPRIGLSHARRARTGFSPSSPSVYVAPAPGLPALIARIKNRLTDPHRVPEKDSLRNPLEYLAGLAIPINQAYAVWGYGVAVEALVTAAHTESNDFSTWSGLVAFRKANPSAAWLHEMRQTLCDEEARRKAVPGAKGVRKEMGKELGGISDKRVGELMREHSDWLKSDDAKVARRYAQLVGNSSTG